MVENMQEVIDYMATNKDVEEVKNYVGGLVTSDRVNSFLDGEDGKKLLQPKLDTYSAKGLESWKLNNLDKLYEERFTKENPKADPRDVEINKVKAQIEAMKTEGTKKDLTNKALKIAQEKKLPIELVDFFVGADDETTIKNLKSLEDVFASHVEAVVTERLKGGYKPTKGTGTDVSYTMEQISKMTTAEINANWDAVQKSMKK